MFEPEASGRDRWAAVAMNRRVLTLVIALVVVAGGSSLLDLPRMEDPVLRPRVGLVNTRLPGADAARVEALVSESVEDSLRDIEEIKELRSVSRQGISTISIELLDSVMDTDAVWSRVRSKIDDAVPRLPPEARRPEFEELEVRAYALILGVKWDAETPVDMASLRRVAIDLQDRLQGLPGTDVVDRFGDPGEEIEVELRIDEVAAIGVTPAMVADKIAARDVKTAAGELRGDRRQLLVEVGNRLEHWRELSELVIGGSGGGAGGRSLGLDGNVGRDVRLGEVADIRTGIVDPPPRMAIADGDVAVVLGIMVRPDFRIDRYTAAAEATLAEFASTLPREMSLTTILRQSDYVRRRLSSLVGNLLVGAAAVSGVVFVLMGLRAAVLVVMTLPLAAMMVLFFLKSVGIPIHQMSITGLIISLGLLIDNAIVIVDEVRSRMAAGTTPREAASRSVRHLAVPLLGSTVTTALAFAPIALMPGPAGEFVGAIAISVMASVFASLALSLTVVPALTAIWSGRLESRAGGEDRPRRWWRDGVSAGDAAVGYRRFVRWMLGHPVAAISLSLSPPLVGFLLAGTLREQFFPGSSRDQFHVTIEGPAVSSLAETRASAMRVDAVLRDDSGGDGARRVDWFLGESAPQFYYNVLANRRGTRNFAQALVTTAPGSDPTAMIRRLQRRLREVVPDSRVLVRQLEQGPPSEAPIEVRLFGPDLDVLRRLGDRARVRLASMTDVAYTRSDLSEVLPAVSIDVDTTAAMDAGLSPRDVGGFFAAALDGVPAGSVLEDNERVPVVVRLDDSDRGDLSRITSMDVGGLRTGAAGEPVPLSAIASVNLTPRDAAINRLNRRRMNEVAAFLNAGVLPSIVQAKFERSLIDDPIGLPAGYSIRYGGTASGRDDAVGNLFSTVGVLAVLMVATLVLSLGSFRATAIIGVVAIGSVGLALLSLALGRYPFGFMGIIGTMGLIGVAINDSIVVLTSVRERSADGATAGLDETADRVVAATRHVVATTLTTIAGFLPLILDGGGFWPPMAICIAGGVSGATLMALVGVPAAEVWARGG